MTDKICGKCGTFIEAGNFCPECGQQLYPDVGMTVWNVGESALDMGCPSCEKPKFDVWTGKKLEEEKK